MTKLSLREILWTRNHICFVSSLFEMSNVVVCILNFTFQHRAYDLWGGDLMNLYRYDWYDMIEQVCLCKDGVALSFPLIQQWQFEVFFRSLSLFFHLPPTNFRRGNPVSISTRWSILRSSEAAANRCSKSAVVSRKTVAMSATCVAIRHQTSVSGLHCELWNSQNDETLTVPLLHEHIALPRRTFEFGNFPPKKVIRMMEWRVANYAPVQIRRAVNLPFPANDKIASFCNAVHSIWFCSSLQINSC